MLIHQCYHWLHLLFLGVFNTNLLQKYIFYTNLDLFCRVLIIFVSINEYDNISSFHKDLIEIKLNGKWGIINANGKIIIPVKYDKIYLIGQ